MDKDTLNYFREVLDFSIYIGKNSFPKEVSVEQNNHQKHYIGALLIRALHKAHAINVLTKEELKEESEIILRVLLEISFVVKAVSESTAFAEKYHNSFLNYKASALKNMNKSIEEGPWIQELVELPQELKATQKSVQEEAKAKESKRISIKDFAYQADMRIHYHGTYSILCSSVHSGPYDLSNYFSIIENEGKKQVVISKPEAKTFNITLMTAVEAMIIILRGAFRIYQIPETDKFKELMEGYEAIRTIMHAQRGKQSV